MAGLILTVLACVILSVQCINFKDCQEEHTQIVESVNLDPDSLWQASLHPLFCSRSMLALRKFVGNTGHHHIGKLDPRSPRLVFKAKRNRMILPVSFDARTEWPKCNATINDIRHQGNCGSCWAHTVAGVMSDRTCISSKGKTLAKFSTQDQLSCMSHSLVTDLLGSNFTDLCGGYDAQAAFVHCARKGIATGGEYNEPTTGCMPYSFWTWFDGLSPMSPYKCQMCSHMDYQTLYVNDKHKCQNITVIGYGLHNSNVSVNRTYLVDPINMTYTLRDEFENTVPNLIMKEISNHGPVTAFLHVYSDFIHYVSGIYHKSTNATYLGGHSVKILGWGATNGTDYWLCANSWGTTWGEMGLFRILRGSNHCHIEYSVVAALPV